MSGLFDESRIYVLGDPELELIGDRAKLAQWRHKGIGPAFYRLGRKIVYRGADLNDWARAHRVETSATSVSNEADKGPRTGLSERRHRRGGSGCHAR